MTKYPTISMIILTSFFSSCSNIENMPTSSPVTFEAKKKVSELTAWQLTGAIAAKQQHQAWSASLTWEQENTTHYRLSFFGPMGGHAVTIEKNHGGATYQEGDHIEHTRHIDSLLSKKTGQQLPLTHLFYWVRGMKSPGKAVERRDEKGHLIALQQAGYSLSYSNYRVINGYDLPTKIEIHHSNGWLKLVIKHWVTHA